jgi:hypothetical protein
MNDIQRRMAHIRRELHEEVTGAVKGAQSLTDWRSQVKNHPWLALGTAAAVGYIIVPRRRRPETPTIVTVNPVAAAPGVGSSAPAPPSDLPRKSRFGILSSVFSLVAPIAARAAQNYAIQYMEQWLAAQQGGTGPAHGPGPAHAAEARPGRTTTSSGVGARPSTPFGTPGRPGDAR